ncbi:MAG: 30S ribosome-binding factor RbfA [Bacilli bacterium]|nr:30S ribosome-binding factor RbfA [Bacilli bacterium]
MSVKIDRINSNIAKELGYILTFESKDPDFKLVTITEVKTTNDLSFSKIYITVLDNEKKDETIKSLNNAARFLRTKLTERIDVRHTPELTFVYDDSIDYGHRIEKLIAEIHNKD